MSLSQNGMLLGQLAVPECPKCQPAAGCLWDSGRDWAYLAKAVAASQVEGMAH